MNCLKKGNNRNDDDNFDEDHLNHHSDSNSQSSPSITYFEVQVVAFVKFRISTSKKWIHTFDNSNSYKGENPTASIDGGGSLSFSDWKPAAKVLSTWGKKSRLTK